MPKGVRQRLLDDQAHWLRGGATIVGHTRVDLHGDVEDALPSGACVPDGLRKRAFAPVLEVCGGLIQEDGYLLHRLTQQILTSRGHGLVDARGCCDEFRLQGPVNGARGLLRDLRQLPGLRDLLSPRAVFSPKDHTARGEQTVRFIQDDVEVTGTRWAYDHAAKKVSLEGDVRVTFRARITDILR